MGGVLISLLLFLRSFSFACLINHFVTICELFFYFRVSCNGSLHPWVADYISKRESLVGKRLKHACNQVLELLCEEAGLVSVSVDIPETVRLVSIKPSILWVFDICLPERSVSSIHHEKDHTKCKKINDVALIWYVIKDFWCEETLCANSSFAEPWAISSFNFGCKSKVNDLAIILIVKQDILELQITMAEAIWV